MPDVDVYIVCPACNGERVDWSTVHRQACPRCAGEGYVYDDEATNALALARMVRGMPELDSLCHVIDDMWLVKDHSLIDNMIVGSADSPEEALWDALEARDG